MFYLIICIIQDCVLYLSCIISYSIKRYVISVRADRDNKFVYNDNDNDKSLFSHNIRVNNQ